ncbi:protein ImuB [Haloactinopolyspora alba]|uniref:Protein ImuB n=1 Tax=Haloactinopolyspora alba TaxID=648780 RepID=A0A2P8DHD2_9ACTN|nr:DNA polymerase Y family protein [Haloactinopolyspora alba]PSK96624.1 protein ImuB [Haloactinopolyspora alba]
MGLARALVLWCPDWPLIAIGVDPAQAAVVVASGRVVACSAAARAAGVRRGQRLRDAQRYCPDVAVHDDDPDGQARAFELVVAAMEEACPRVEVIRPGLAAVPVRGPARYYGGEGAVAATVRDAVLESGFTCAVGVADGTFAADLAARRAWDESCGDDGGQGVRVVPSASTAAFLAPHPVAVLEMPELTDVLVRLGVRTLGDLAALPGRDVLARFGADGEAAHRLAWGRQARAPATRAPGEDLGAEFEFDPPTAQSEPAVFAAKSLADRMHDNLAARGLACTRVEIEAVTADGRSRSRLWRHDGRLSGLAVAERVRWQLNAWRTSGELAAELTFLRLAPDQLVVDTGRQLTLWGRHEVDDAVARVADRLQVMLGHAAVTRPVPSGGRGPAAQVARVPWGDSTEPASQVQRPWPGRVPDPAPSVVHPEPEPVDLLDTTGVAVVVSGRSVVPEPPVRLVLGDGTELDVTGWTGPWPASERWWDARRGRRLARLQVLTDDGRAWLLLVEQGRWSAEAVYA